MQHVNYSNALTNITETIVNDNLFSTYQFFFNNKMKKSQRVAEHLGQQFIILTDQTLEFIEWKINSLM